MGKACEKKNFKQLTDAITRIEKYLGTLNNTEEKTVTWELNKINEKLGDIENSLLNFFKYESEQPVLNHIIEHNLDTFFVNLNVLVKRESYWENVLCNIKYLDSNRIQIEFSEPETIMVSIYKI